MKLIHPLQHIHELQVLIIDSYFCHQQYNFAAQAGILAIPFKKYALNYFFIPYTDTPNPYLHLDSLLILLI